MSRRVRFFERYTVEQLAAMLTDLHSQPQVARGINLYTKAQQSKMDDIAWAIYYHAKADCEPTDSKGNE